MRDGKRFTAVIVAPWLHIFFGLISVFEALLKPRFRARALFGNVPLAHPRVDPSTCDRFIQDLTVKATELHQMIEIQERLISNLSHEVKNPLGVIIGCSDLLREAPEVSSGGESLGQAIDAIQRNALQILSIVQDQLDRSAEEFKSPSLKMSLISLDELAQRTEFSMGLLAKQKGLTLEVHNQIAGGSVETDSRLLNQILNNLIGNAIKFTKKGFIRVDLFSDAHTKLCIEVKDSGCGIEPADQTHLFEPFLQASRDATLRSQGTGLGLSIVRDIAIQFGGEVSLVKSHPSFGSTFLVKIPFRSSQSPTINSNLRGMASTSNSESEFSNLQFRSMPRTRIEVASVQWP